MMDVIKKNNKKNNKQNRTSYLILKKKKHIVKLHFSETVFTLIPLYLPSEIIKTVL